jgi:hypothetical protein
VVAGEVAAEEGLVVVAVAAAVDSRDQATGHVLGERASSHCVRTLKRGVDVAIAILRVVISATSAVLPNHLTAAAAAAAAVVVVVVAVAAEVECYVAYVGDRIYCVLGYGGSAVRCMVYDARACMCVYQVVDTRKVSSSRMGSRNRGHTANSSTNHRIIQAQSCL